MRGKLIFLATVLLISATLGGFGTDLAPKIKKIGLMALKEGTKVPDFELKELNGSAYRLSSLKGKVVFINFWATWCPPCREEMPSMQKLYDKFRDAGLEILAVDLQEDAKTVRPFVEEHRLTFPILLDEKGILVSKYGVRGLPTSYIINREGFAVAGYVGAKDWSTPDMIDFFQTLLMSDH
jgi:peroxiredoxin